MDVVTVRQLVDEVEGEVGLTLNDVGLYLDGPAGTTRAILAGLRKGLADVAVSASDPVAVADADVACLSRFAAERVKEVATLHCLRLALLRWHRASQSAGAEPLAKSDDVRGGWLWEQKQAARDRVAQLAADLQAPYREPSAGFVVAAPDPAASPSTRCLPYGGCC